MGHALALNDFSYSVLKAATQKFNNKNLLGEGGFGQVYRGWIDSYTMTAAKPGKGLKVAIKRLRMEGLQGHKEWQVSKRIHMWYYISLCGTHVWTSIQRFISL